MDNKSQENDRANALQEEQNTEQQQEHQENLQQDEQVLHKEQVQHEDVTPPSSNTVNTEQHTTEANEQAYLEEAASASTSATIDSPNEPQQPSEQLQQAKMMSKQYVNYYMNALKEPLHSLSRTDEKHYVNALITMGIIAVLFPLFIVLTAARIGIGISFFGMFVQPLIYAALSMLAAIGSIYVFDKWQGGDPNWKQITVRYATLLVPVPLCLIIASFFGLIGVSARLTLFFFTLSVLFILIPLNVLLVQRQTSLSTANSKIDPLYQFVIANLIVGSFLYGIATSAISALISSLFRSWIPF